MEHVYVANRASGFNFTVVREDDKGKETRYRVRFEKGQFKTDDDKLAALVDAAIDRSPGIRRNIRKADREAALKLALAHKRMMDTTGAHKGGVTADAVKTAMTDSLAARDKELRDANVSPDVEAFAADGLQLTQPVPQVAEAADGAVPADVPTGVTVKPATIILGAK
jgi:hypothetical protein